MQTIGRGDMKVSHLAQSIGRCGISVQVLFLLIATVGAGTTGASVLRAGELDTSPAVAEVRIVPGAASATIEQELHSADRALLQAIVTNDVPAAKYFDDPLTRVTSR